mmetsp:Transcript_41855/g.132284  ORF Transcript_41855/g.132284 Transcript_41855/m.132284 type:complete len:459 (-) Transcript_41855:344-1720(-)
MQVTGTRVEGSVLVVMIRLNLNLTMGTIEDVVGKRSKVVKNTCDNILEEVKNELRGPVWSEFCSSIKDSTEEVAQAVLVDVEKQVDRIKSRPAEDFNADDIFLSETNRIVAVGGEVRIQRAQLLRRVSKQLKDVAVAEELQKVAAVFCSDEFVECQIDGTFEMEFPGSGEFWFPKALGFEEGLDGSLQVSAASSYKSTWGQHETALARIMEGQELPLGQVLLGINGRWDVLDACQELQKHCQENQFSLATFRLPTITVEFTIGRTRGEHHMLEKAQEIAKAAETNNGLRRISRLFEMSNVQELEMVGSLPDGPQLDDKAGTWIAAGLIGAPALRVLNLGQNCLGRRFAEALGSTLQGGGLPKLQELELYGCGLDDEAGARLAAGLAAAAALRKLDLASNPDLDGGFAAALAASLQGGGLPKLEELRLEDCDLDDEAKEQIRKAWLGSSRHIKRLKIRG